MSLRCPRPHSLNCFGCYHDYCDYKIPRVLSTSHGYSHMHSISHMLSCVKVLGCCVPHRSSIKTFLLYATPVTSPLVLTRAWCLFEVAQPLWP